jgi:hypothetical protein
MDQRNERKGPDSVGMTVSLIHNDPGIDKLLIDAYSSVVLGVELTTVKAQIGHDLLYSG